MEKEKFKADFWEGYDYTIDPSTVVLVDAGLEIAFYVHVLCEQGKLRGIK